MSPWFYVYGWYREFLEVESKVDLALPFRLYEKDELKCNVLMHGEVLEEVTKMSICDQYCANMVQWMGNKRKSCWEEGGLIESFGR